MRTGKISVFTAALLAMVFITGGMAEAKKPITLKFAGINPVEHSSTVEMKKMAKNIEKETNGEVKVRVFPAGQLGDYTLGIRRNYQGHDRYGAYSHTDRI